MTKRPCGCADGHCEAADPDDCRRIQASARCQNCGRDINKHIRVSTDDCGHIGLVGELVCPTAIFRGPED